MAGWSWAWACRVGCRLQTGGDRRASSAGGRAGSDLGTGTFCVSLLPTRNAHAAALARARTTAPNPTCPLAAQATGNEAGRTHLWMSAAWLLLALIQNTAYRFLPGTALHGGLAAWRRCRILTANPSDQNRHTAARYRTKRCPGPHRNTRRKLRRLERTRRTGCATGRGPSACCSRTAYGRSSRSRSADQPATPWSPDTRTNSISTKQPHQLFPPSDARESRSHSRCLGRRRGTG